MQKHFRNMASPTVPLLLLRIAPTKNRHCRTCHLDLERIYFQPLDPAAEAIGRVCIYCRVKPKVVSTLESETGEDCFPAYEDTSSVAFKKASRVARALFGRWMNALAANGIAIITVTCDNGIESTNGDNAQVIQAFVDNFMRLITQVAGRLPDHREPLHHLLVTLGPVQTPTPPASQDEDASSGDAMPGQGISVERTLLAEDVDDEEAATRPVLTRQRTNSLDRELLALAEDSDDPDVAPADRAHHGYDGAYDDYDAGHHGYDGTNDDYDAAHHGYDGADDGHDVVSPRVTVTAPKNSDDDFEMMETDAADDWDATEFEGFADDEDSAAGVVCRDNNSSESTSPGLLLANLEVSELKEIRDFAIKLEQDMAEVAALADDAHGSSKGFVNYMNDIVTNSANSENGA